MLWVVLASRVDPGAEGAEQAGYLVGSWLSTLAFALLIRFGYWLIRRRKVAFLSPWVFVIAAAIGLVVKLGDAGDQIRRDEQSTRVVSSNQPAARPATLEIR